MGLNFFLDDYSVLYMFLLTYSLKPSKITAVSPRNQSNLLVAVPQVLQVGKGDVWFGSRDEFHLTLGWVSSHQHHQSPVRQRLQQQQHPLNLYYY